MTTGLQTGSLWGQLRARTASAIASGALRSIETDYHSLKQEGAGFVVRVARNLERKAQEKRKQHVKAPNAPFNPFLPPEPELTVADITPTHLAVLNKFNVVENHLLIVTRLFQHQQRLLTLEDFEALWRCMAEYPSLGFYNGGEAAGASQQHKHLQLVPLPLYPGLGATPFDPLFACTPRNAGVQCLNWLPFEHRWHPLPKGLANSISSAAEQTLSLYRRMLHSVGIRTVRGDDGDYQSAPYNLLLTGDWMLLVPRSRECSHGISVNALGYVGSLFVKSLDELEILERVGPMNLLKAVSITQV